MKFYAAFKGVDLDKDENAVDPEEAFEKAKRRANAKLSGKTDAEIDREVEYAELSDFGLEVEI